MANTNRAVQRKLNLRALPTSRDPVQRKLSLKELLTSHNQEWRLLRSAMSHPQTNSHATAAFIVPK
jgi:hypothetical protein